MTSIITTRSAINAMDRCGRLRWLSYEAPNGTNVRGWERRALALPLATGQYTHVGLADLLKGSVANIAAAKASALYKEVAVARGLDADAPDVAYVIAEQAALIEALVLAWARVRLPLILDEYEILEVEREEAIDLPDGNGPTVRLLTRSDFIAKRKHDGAIFIWNPKTVGDAGEWWYRQWEVDSQLLTEVLPVEQRLGRKVAGVIIEGLIKGKRMPEKDRDGNITGRRQASPLIYGYKFDGNPPLEPPKYDHAYTRAKGWHRFHVWEETFDFLHGAPVLSDPKPFGVGFWVNWLPEEVVAAQFAVVPPIMRSEERIKSKVVQIVSRERRLAEWASICTQSPEHVDRYFTQNEHSCNFPTKCPMYDACWTGGVREDMQGSGLYIPRVANHPGEEEL